MNRSTLTAKGQVTIPRRLREYLGISPRDTVQFECTADGAVCIVVPSKSRGKGKKVSRISALRGTRKTGRTTDQIMNVLRRYSEDTGDPGFKAAKN